jgi:hypothetical protein
MEGETAKSESSPDTYNLFAYNTSFANDAHWSQLHFGLSESAAIVAKAIDIYTLYNNSQPTDFNALDTFFKGEQFKKIDQNNQIDPIDDDMPKKLGYIRMQFADKATEYLNTQMTDSTNPASFIALVEQMIHVPETNASYYGGFTSKSNLNSEFPIEYKKTPNPNESPLETVQHPSNGDQNEKYGILRRIKKMNLIDIDNSSEAQAALEADDNKTHVVVYDNCVNVDAPFAAEGIAMAIDKRIFGKNGFNIVKWARNVQPIRKLLGETANIDGQELSYFLHDLGVLLQSCEKTVTDKNSLSNSDFLFIKENGVFDYGRPIIVSASHNDTTLNIFVALHNPNIMNLVYVDINSSLTRALKQPAENLTDSTEEQVTDATKLVNEEVKQNALDNAFRTKINDIKNRFGKDLYDLIARGSLFDPGNRKKIFTDDLMKEYIKKYKVSVIEDKEILSAVFKRLNKCIGDVITQAFASVTNLPASITEARLFLGGDFNDPRGDALADLKKNGITFSLPNLPNINKFTFGDETDPEKILTCCANRESQLWRRKLEFKDTSDPELEKIQQIQNKHLTETVGSLETAFDRILVNGEKYPDGFSKSENFGYNGDYVLFGSSNAPPQSTMSIKSPDAQLLTFTKDGKICKVMASDHLPVYTSVTITATATEKKTVGGRRRRYSRRAPIRRTRKGVPKKLRASRRKRRARTYKKI